MADKQSQNANGDWQTDRKKGDSGHFGEIMMFPQKKGPFNTGLFLPARKQLFSSIVVVSKRKIETLIGLDTYQNSEAK